MAYSSVQYPGTLPRVIDSQPQEQEQDSNNNNNNTTQSNQLESNQYHEAYHYAATTQEAPANHNRSSQATRLSARQAYEQQQQQAQQQEQDDSAAGASGEEEEEVGEEDYEAGEEEAEEEESEDWNEQVTPAHWPSLDPNAQEYDWEDEEEAEGEGQESSTKAKYQVVKEGCAQVGTFLKQQYDRLPRIRFMPKRKYKLIKEYRILEDLSNGRSACPISVYSTRKKDKPPTEFKFMNAAMDANEHNMTQTVASLMSNRCTCKGDCSSRKCQCIQASDTNLGLYVTGQTKKVLGDHDCPRIYECHELCDCNKGGCKNRITQTEPKIKFEVFRTEDRGWGLRPTHKIPAGTFIGDYMGEYIDLNEYERSDRESAYYFDCGSDFTMDASRFGNHLRFVNHSCVPNCHFVQVLTHRDDRFAKVSFFTKVDIKPFEELTIDYGSDYWWYLFTNYGVGCLCRHPTCYYSVEAIQRSIDNHEPWTLTDEELQTPATAQTQEATQAPSTTNDVAVISSSREETAAGVPATTGATSEMPASPGSQRQASELPQQVPTASQHSVHSAHSVHSNRSGVSRRAQEPMEVGQGMEGATQMPSQEANLAQPNFDVCTEDQALTDEQPMSFNESVSIAPDMPNRDVTREVSTVSQIAQQ